MIKIFVEGVELRINLEENTSGYNRDSYMDMSLNIQMFKNKFAETIIRDYIPNNKQFIDEMKKICSDKKHALLALRHDNPGIAKLAFMKIRYFADIDIPMALPGEPSKIFDTVDDGIMDYLKSGKTIQAIKAYRCQYGTGLKESKDAIEKIKENLEASKKRNNDFWS